MCLYYATIGGAFWAFLNGLRLSLGEAHAFSFSPPLRKFVQRLPVFGSEGIPVASPIADPVFPDTDFYEIVAGQYRQKLHPDLPKATRLWGYADATNNQRPKFSHLGPAIVVQKGRNVRLRVTNTLPPRHPLPVDTSILGVVPFQNRIAVHLHGGFIPWISDGGPHDWYDPKGRSGLSFLNGPGGVLDNIPGKPMKPGQADYFYTNDLSSRLMFYHDHAWGMTRLNVYAGMAAPYIVRDDIETAMYKKGLPSGRFELPLVIQDKTFVSGPGDPSYDPNYQWGEPGDLWYPYLYEPDRWPLETGGSPPVPSIVPESFGDTMLVNGVAYPFHRVKQTTYRLRILNACNARFVRLRLVGVKGRKFPQNAEPNTNLPGPKFRLIGNECGFLNGKIYPQGYVTDTLLLGPAERADVLVDFSGSKEGASFLLYNDGAAPFPDGDPRYDFYPGSPNPAITTQPGYGPNSQTLMKFVVGEKGPQREIAFNLPEIDPLPIPDDSPRILGLFENIDLFGRVTPMMGTSVPLEYMRTATEVILTGATEVWQVFNFTPDTHPIHIHLANFQVLSRRAFVPSADAQTFNFLTPPWTGPSRGPDPDEQGWKETIRMGPSEATLIVAKFDLPKAPFKIPLSRRTGGHEYVYHCHILEHEEHDMMRPLVVIP